MMPKLNPLDDQNTYYKYAFEAQQRIDNLAKELAAKKQAGQGLFGKAGAVIKNVGDMPQMGLKGSGDTFETADAAQDHLINTKESMLEDAQQSRNNAERRINQLNGNAARAAKERARMKK